MRGEPIVESPTDAFQCFMGTDLDFLIIGNSVLIKENQSTDGIKNYRDQYELDWTQPSLAYYGLSSHSI